MLKVSRTYYPKSFQDIVNDILTRLKTNYNIKVIPRSTFEALVNAFAYAVDNFLFYLNFVYNELFMDTAITEESILRLASFYGYNRKGAIPARLIANGNAPGDVVMLDAFSFYKFLPLGDNKTFYEGNKVITSISIEPDSSWEYKSFFIKTSLKPAHNMIIAIDGSGRTWIPFERFKIQFASDGNYTLVPERVFWVRHFDNGFYITFGNAEYTELPDSESLTVIYLETNGNIGQVSVDEEGNIVIDDQSYKFIQGSDIESIESVRRIAPEAFWIKDDRILTAEDIVVATRKFNPSYRAMVSYFNTPETLNKTFPFEFYVNKIEASINSLASFGANDSELRNHINEINYYWNLFKRLLTTLSFPALPAVNLHVLKKTFPFQLSEAERAELSNYINERVPFGSWVYVLSDSEMAILVSIEIQYKPKAGLDIENWKNDVIRLILNYFDNLDYGFPLRTSNIYSIVESTGGVDYFSINYSFKQVSTGADASNLIIPRYERQSGFGIPVEFLPKEGYIFVSKQDEIKFVEIK